jgi:GcrA cell cycle regulator
MTDATLTWTEERVERLKTLWQEGKSASYIASELGGVSRNAVIGKVHRLGLSGRGKAPEKAPAPRPRTKPAAAEPAATGASAKPMSIGANALAAAVEERIAPEAEPIARALPRPATEPASEIVVPLSERVTIMDLRESMCRWPMGDPSSAEFRFCGARSLTGLPYCDHHAQIAYQPSAERRRDRKSA